MKVSLAFSEITWQPFPRISSLAGLLFFLGPRGYSLERLTAYLDSVRDNFQYALPQTLLFGVQTTWSFEQLV